MNRLPPRWLPVACLAAYGCGPAATPVEPGPPSSTGGTSPTGSAGSNGTAGSNQGTGAGTTGGFGTTAGSGTTGGTGPTGGAGSTGGTGTSGGAGGTASVGGAATGCNATPPTHALNITAAKARHDHMAGGRPFAMDNRAPKMLGKLIIDLGVDSGGIYNFGLNRGFHVYGGKIFHCDLTYDNRTHNGDCRLETVDGQDHDPTVNIPYAESLAGRLAAGLAQLHQDFPEEDWGYFLTADGKVRWDDVGMTGFSHGAQTAARTARAMCLYRAVSRSGPRDNECGKNDQTPPYDVNCDLSRVSAWLDEPAKSPIEHFFAFVGMNDSQRGDGLYSMQRMGYIGEPVDISTVPYPYNGSHRFVASGEGHSGFDDKKYWPALGIAWGVPKENMDYAADL